MVTDPATGSPIRPSPLRSSTTRARSTSPRGLRSLYEFFHPLIRGLARTAGWSCSPASRRKQASPEAAIAQQRDRGLHPIAGEGDTAPRARPRSSCCVAAGGEAAASESTLRFLLSRQVRLRGWAGRSRSARRGHRGRRARRLGAPTRRAAWRAVTGAARGIGEAIAATLGRDGAEARSSIDVPPRRADLRRGRQPPRRHRTTAGHHGRRCARAARRPRRRPPRQARRRWSTTPGSPATRRSAEMDPEQWDAVLDVNLASAAATERARCSTATCSAPAAA